MDKHKLLFGQRIKYFRRLKHITQEQLAEKVNRSKNHISKIEQGSANPPLELIIDISNALSVKPSELFAFEKQLHCNINYAEELNKITTSHSNKHLKFLYNISQLLEINDI